MVAACPALSASESPHGERPRTGQRAQGMPTGGLLHRIQCVERIPELRQQICGLFLGSSPIRRPGLQNGWFHHRGGVQDQCSLWLGFKDPKEQRGVRQVSCRFSSLSPGYQWARTSMKGNGTGFGCADCHGACSRQGPLMKERDCERPLVT